MTVKELKEIIASLPDNTPVQVYASHSDHEALDVEGFDIDAYLAADDSLLIILYIKD